MVCFSNRVNWNKIITELPQTEDTALATTVPCRPPFESGRQPHLKRQVAWFRAKCHSLGVMYLVWTEKKEQVSDYPFNSFLKTFSSQAQQGKHACYHLPQAWNSLIALGPWSKSVRVRAVGEFPTPLSLVAYTPQGEQTPIFSLGHREKSLGS